jgi:hypothetical protein
VSKLPKSRQWDVVFGPVVMSEDKALNQIAIASTDRAC